MGTRSQALVLTISLVLIAAVPIGSSTATPTDPTVIVGDETWDGGTFVVTEHIVVASGSTLTIRDAVVDFQAGELCTIARINGLYCQPDLQVEAGGSLIIEDSTITSTSADLSDWPLIQVLGDVEATGSTFQDINGLVAMFDAADAHIVGNEVYNMLGEIGVWRGATGVIADNRIEGGHGTISAQDASPEIRGNELVDIDSFGVRVQQSIVGDKPYVTAPIIEGNTFVRTSTGIFSDTGAGITIQDNAFEQSTYYAISLRVPTQDYMLQDAPPSIVANTFEDNGNDIRVYTVPRNIPGASIELEVHENAFLGADCSYIDASQATGAPLTVDATGNWWASPTGPQDPADPDCDAFTGDATILYNPWLTSPP